MAGRVQKSYRIFNQRFVVQRGIRFMKHHTAKRSDEELKFFTRELYAKFNSSNDDEADEADEEWESAIRDYDLHLRSIAKHMPEDVKELANLCLHDAELIHPKELFLSQLPESGVVGVALREKGDLWRVYLILYLLCDEVRVVSPPPNWPYPRSPYQWMYDEVDVSEKRRIRYVHRIMLSDGRVVVVPFTHVKVHAFYLRAASPEGLVAQPA